MIEEHSPVDPTPQWRSIEHLESLYTVVAAVSVSIVGERVTGSINGQTWARIVPLVLAFLVTLVPFYHGTLRHLDDTYRSSTGPMPGRRLLWDYGFLFVEG